jgi:hypothetical protein
MDYIMYTVDEDLAVGVLLAEHANKTPQECMGACATNGCELVSLALRNMPDAPGVVSGQTSNLLNHSSATGAH